MDYDDTLFGCLRRLRRAWREFCQAVKAEVKELLGL